MLGHFAIDCTVAASAANPHLIYAISPKGEVTRTLEMAKPELDGTFAISKMRLLAPDRLQFKDVGRRNSFTVSIIRSGIKFRSWKSIRDDGEVIIEDGKFRKSGSPTLVFEPCAD